MKTEVPTDVPRPSRNSLLSFADVLFIIFSLAIMQHAGRGMMDDPGLGWHLRLPDLMIEQGGFVYDEHFSFPTAGNRWVTSAWLSDIILRGAYAWGQLNAVALLTCMVFAVTLRGIYRRLVDDGHSWAVAVVATVFAATGLIPSFMARPNAVSFLGIWLVADLCQRFHRNQISPRSLCWLVPLMLLWANMHGGFLAGMVLMAVAWLVEAALSVASWQAEVRYAARQRLWWLTLVGVASGIATCVNPNGIGLHIWNLQAISDPFIQRQTTTEWRPPDFTEGGWFNIERLILLLPLLAATTRRRVNFVGLAMTVVFLHFALTGRRYSTMWVVIAAPTLCELAVHNTWLRQLLRRTKSFVSADMRRQFGGGNAVRSSALGSWVAAALLLLVTPCLPDWASHNQATMPSEALDKFLAMHDGAPTFHSANWGGYLTWQGWDREHRFLTWIDDRIEVHGKEHLQEYFRIMEADADWQAALDSRNVQWVCIPAEARLAKELAHQGADWEQCLADERVAVYRRKIAPALVSGHVISNESSQTPHSD